MKNIIFALCSLLLVGCSSCLADPVESMSPVSNETSEVSDTSKYGQDTSEFAACSPYFTSVTVDDVHYIVEMPSLCSATPVIYNGDPGPDYGVELTYIDPDYADWLVMLAEGQEMGSPE